MGSLNAFIGAVYVPMALCLIYNFAVLGAIVNSIRSCGKKVLSTTTKSSNMQTVRVVLFLSCLLGLTWSFAIFVILFKHLAFQYIFAILNTLQGVFIFCFHVARSDDARKLWVATFKSFSRSTGTSHVEEIDLESKTRRVSPTITSSGPSSNSSALNPTPSGGVSGGVINSLVRESVNISNIDT